MLCTFCLIGTLRHGVSDEEQAHRQADLREVRDVLLQDVLHDGHVEAVPAHGGVDDGLQVLGDRVGLHQHLSGLDHL